MDIGKHILVSLVLLATTELALASVESGNSVKNETRASARSGRKDYVVYSKPDNYASKKANNFYSPDEESISEEDVPAGFEPSLDPRSSKDGSLPPQPSPPYAPPTYEEYVPAGYYQPPSPQRPNPRYYSPSPMYKSGSSVNWNVWKGDPTETASPPPPVQFSKGGPPPPEISEYYFPGDAWKGDPWQPDQMSNMMMMMNQMQNANKPKFGGFLSKLAQEPLALMVAAILPFSLLLAAVLPSLVNMMMNGGLPTITTTATGNTGRSLDGTEYLSPVLQTITAFGARSFDNPDCMQRIFCQVTKGTPGNGSEARSFQKSLYTASRLIDSHWLETFGVKTLFESMADGNCEKIPCSLQKPSSPSATRKSKIT